MDAERQELLQTIERRRCHLRDPIPVNVQDSDVARTFQLSEALGEADEPGLAEIHQAFRNLGGAHGISLEAAAVEGGGHLVVHAAIREWDLVKADSDGIGRS